MNLMIHDTMIGSEENERMACDMASYLRGCGYACRAVDAPHLGEPSLSEILYGGEPLALLVGPGRPADELTPDEWTAAVLCARGEQEARDVYADREASWLDLPQRCPTLMAGLRYRHTSWARGYESRTNGPRVVRYRGRFGAGVKVHLPTWDSTQYHRVAYYIKAND